jgi:hypothetical protein
MPLNHLDCDFNAKRDAEILLWSIKTLEQINGQDAKQLLLADTTWTGSEDLKGSGALTFQLDAKVNVTMIDTDGNRPVKYTLKGDNVTFKFNNQKTNIQVVYSGTIAGNGMSGSAQYGAIKWNWNVKKQ